MAVAGVAPGSMREEPAGKLTEAPKSSLPVKDFSISALAVLKALWPETYSPIRIP